MAGRALIIFTALMLAFPVTGCDEKIEPPKVNLAKKEAAPEPAKTSNGAPLRIAVGGMITPKEGFVYYRNFLDYIGAKLDRRVEFVDREDYAEINKMLESGEIDAAFVCSGPYVDGYKEFGLRLLAAPQAYGETVYYSYIIVSAKGPIKDFEQLRGLTFAFTDPLSNTGKLVPTYMLAKMNETPETFFKTFIFTKTHDKAIRAVAQGVVDGAAVDSLIWEYQNRIDPKYTSRTRIIRKSPPYAIPPFVVRPGLEPATIDRLRDVILNAHADEKGTEILKGMMIDKFVPIEDGAYDSIREMKGWVAKQGKTKQPDRSGK